MSEIFKVVSSEQLLSSFVFDVERRTVAGAETHFERDVVVHNGAVAVIPVRSDGHVGLLKQYRATFDREIWEIPAGTLDVYGESVIDAAQRELLEEIGGVSNQWRALGTYMVSPGWTNQVMHLFEASNVELSASSPSGPEEEAMSVHWLDLAEIQELVTGTEILDYSLSMALLRRFGEQIYGC